MSRLPALIGHHHAGAYPIGLGCEIVLDLISEMMHIDHYLADTPQPQVYL